VSKVTSKRRITIPKALAEEYGIIAGSEVFFEPAGADIRLRVATPRLQLDLDERLRLFDAETARQAVRDAAFAQEPTGLSSPGSGQTPQRGRRPGR
jgi:AbrB family looped-hinge helix DNA binding protein